MSLAGPRATLDAIDALVPAVRSRLALVLRLRAELKRLFVALEGAGHPPGQDLPEGGVPDDVRRERALFEGMSEVLAGELGAIGATGAVIRDIEAGHLDWPLDGGDLHACWRPGEPRIGYAHAPGAPCADRRPVEGRADGAAPGAAPGPGGDAGGGAR